MDEFFHEHISPQQFMQTVPKSIDSKAGECHVIPVSLQYNKIQRNDILPFAKQHLDIFLPSVMHVSSREGYSREERLTSWETQEHEPQEKWS